MIVSMTGFGKSEKTYGKTKYSIEIRSVNNKFCDISLKYPKNLTSKDFELREIIRNRVSRGKINVSITALTEVEDTEYPEVNKDLINSYFKLLKSIRILIGSDEKICLNHILTFKDLFETEAVDTVSEEEFGFISKLLEETISDLLNMKSKEGISLKKDILKRIKFIEKESAAILKISNARLKNEKEKINSKVRSLLNDKRIIDENRLELEIILLADKIDITEEIIRLRSHTKYFTEYANSGEHSGRRLNFLTQEINREINTIASKSLDAEISQKVSVLKEELEKIKEQLQNVE